MYLSLYRKYRPRTFEDVISQPYITRTLQNQLKSGQTAHAYLFTGSRGTGKTTCAQILAKALNCTGLKNGNPCLECDACLLIENGTPDITEIDAASNNGVDDVRALRDEIVYSPVNCKYRVYIIDEVHMLSASAFNALLKTVEEPPSHVVFILATTESHKVPSTVVSRCQRFEFSRISPSEGAARLLKIAELEKIPLDNDAAALISRLSDGGMRDAINLLDTCAASAKERITSETVGECAGIAGREHLFLISEAVLNRDCANALMILDSLHKRSKDMGRLIDELIYHYRNLMLLKIMPEAASEIISVLPQDMEEYRTLCGKTSLEHIMRALGILEECFEKINRTKERRLLTEMCFVSLCTPKLDSGEKALLARIEKLERKILQTAEKNTGAEDLKTEITQEAEEDEISSGVYPVPEGITPPEVNIGYGGWREVLNLLPDYLSGMLDDVVTGVDGESGEPVIYGNELIKGLLENPENNEKLLAAIKRVSDGKLQKYRFAGTEIKENISEADPLRSFLDMAKAEGIEVKIR